MLYTLCIHTRIHTHTRNTCPVFIGRLYLNLESKETEEEEKTLKSTAEEAEEEEDKGGGCEVDVWWM